MKLRIMLTGKDGQVGSELAVLLPRLGSVRGLGRRDLDLTNASAIRAAVRSIAPQVIVNAAAYTDVNGAESNESLAIHVNSKAVRIIADEAAKCGAVVIHLSTDYVFDGKQISAYLETDSPNPLNAYGRSKLAGEKALLRSRVPCLIFRTSWVYGLHGRNFFMSILRLASEREELRIVSDQIGAPCWSRMIAAATFRVLRRLLARGYDLRLAAELGGVYHLTSGGQTSWAGFASAILETIDGAGKLSDQVVKALRDKPIRSRRVIPISSDQFSSPARRPLHSVLSNDKFIRRFGFCLPGWRDQLRMAVADLSVDKVLLRLESPSTPCLQNV